MSKNRRSGGLKTVSKGSCSGPKINTNNLPFDIQELYDQPDTQEFLRDYAEWQKAMGYLPDDHGVKRSGPSKYSNLKTISTDKEYRDNLNAMNQFLGSTKRLLKELYFEACSPSSDGERFARLETDMLNVLKDFLIQARIRHFSLKGGEKDGLLHQ